MSLGYSGQGRKGTRRNHFNRAQTAYVSREPDSAGRALYADESWRQARPERLAGIAKDSGEIWYHEPVDRGAESGQSGGPEGRLTSVLEAGSSMRKHTRGPR